MIGQSIKEWMKTDLGAMFSTRTCSQDILKQINDLLKSECSGTDYRELYFFEADKIILPIPEKNLRMHNFENLDGLLARVTVQYDNENITKQFAGDRASLYGKITKRKLFPEEIKDFETDQERRIKNGYLTPEDWEASPAESKEDKASPTESTKEEVADKEAQRLLAIKE